MPFGFPSETAFGFAGISFVARNEVLGDYSSQVGQHPVVRVKRRACGISEARRVCQDESDTIISGGLRRLTVRGSKPDKNALHRRINAEEQYQHHSVSIRYSDSFPVAGLCTSASC